jgi:hypothetical protein
VFGTTSKTFLQNIFQSVWNRQAGCPTFVPPDTDKNVRHILMQEADILKKRIMAIEKKINSMQDDSPLIQGFGTSRYAKISRKRDMLAQQKMNLIFLLSDLGFDYEYGQLKAIKQ